VGDLSMSLPPPWFKIAVRASTTFEQFLNVLKE
jgi:hypothetical protein